MHEVKANSHIQVHGYKENIFKNAIFTCPILSLLQSYCFLFKTLEVDNCIAVLPRLIVFFNYFHIVLLM